MYVYLEREERYISFKTTDGDVIYDILISNLGDANNYADGRISEYVYDIAPKSWARRELLEDLCEIIQMEVPTNDIDWDATNEYINCYL